MKLDPDALTAARDRTLPDVLPALGEPFHVLFCGINPGLYSAATGGTSPGQATGSGRPCTCPASPTASCARPNRPS